MSPVRAAALREVVAQVEPIDLVGTINPAVRRKLDLDLWTLFAFHPDRFCVDAVLHDCLCRGWRLDPYLVAALVCHRWGGEEYNYRAARYARAGGWNPRALGISE